MKPAMVRSFFIALLVCFFSSSGLSLAETQTAHSTFHVELPPPRAATELLPASPFGINTAFDPDPPDLETILEKMQQAGIKWGRQDFTWRKIEKAKGRYSFEAYDRLVELCRKHGIILFANLAYSPEFHDPRTPEGVAAYCEFARATVKHFAGRITHYQIWNEPNGGFWKGTPEQYARLLAAAGRAIHQADPDAKVLGLNMAFCDCIWAKKILDLVPYDCFDIACFHPYRVPSSPEEKFDWWELDQYVKSWHRHDLDPNYPLVRMSFLEQTGELIKVMAEYGKPKPIWITEICWNSQIHPYGVLETRQADLAVRFHVLAIASRKIEKVFWWTLRDIGTRQFDQADIVGMLRNDLTPKYSYYAFAYMTRMLEGAKWLRNDSFGPEIYAVVFTDLSNDRDIIVAWATKPYAYIRVNNEKGLTIHDIYGTQRFVPVVEVRTTSLPVPLGTSPLYITGAKGLRARVRPDPGW